MTRPEDLLHDALERRAARTTWDPTPAADVARRAGRAHRRRRAAAMAGATVLVAAVVVPVSLLRDPDGSDDPAVEVAPAIAVDATSAPPTIGYAVDDVYRPVVGGPPVDLPFEPTSVTPVDHDQLLLTDDPGAGGPLLLQRVTRQGAVGPAVATTSRPVVSVTGELAYTLATSSGGRAACVLRVEQPGRPTSERRIEAGALLLGIDDDGVVAFTDARARRVAVLGRDQATATATPVPGLGSPAGYGATTRLISDVRADADGGGVVDEGGRRLWDLEGTLPGAFSDGGTRLLATTGDDLEVRDAQTGELLLTLPGAAEPGSATELRDVVWEDDAHLLASRPVDDGRELVRVGPDGTTTPLTVPPVPADADLVWDTRP